MNRIKIIILVVVATLGLRAGAQEQTDNALDSVEIGLLTCEPFHEIYSLYGHTGLRVHDLKNGNDMVVNWGVFDMKQNWFALKFIFGITDYWMGVLPTQDFLDEYNSFHCGVREQVLNLTDREKKKILNAIEENAKPENRQYRYNFLFDNCTTRARDIVEVNLDGELRIYGAKESESSFRNEIHQWNDGHPWYRWGNDMLMGIKADRSTTLKEREFLPDSLRKDWDYSKKVTTTGIAVPLVKETRWLVPKQYVPAEMSTWERMLIGPYVIVWVTIAILLLARFTKWGYWLKGGLYIVIGIVGLLLFAMIFSQHPTVSLNLQLLVFNPLWLWAGWLVLTKKSNKRPLLWGGLVGLLILSLPLGLHVQHFAEGVVTLALVLLIDLLYEKKIEKRK